LRRTDPDSLLSEEIGKQPEPIGKQPEPIGKQPEPIGKQPERVINKQPEPKNKQPERVINKQPELKNNQPELKNKQPELKNKQPEPANEGSERENIRSQVAQETAMSSVQTRASKDTMLRAELPDKALLDRVEFNLNCIKNNNILAISESLVSLDKGLLSSLLRVSDLKYPPNSMTFMWPQLDSNTGLGAARQAFTAFVSLQVAKLSRPTVLLFGEQVLKLLPEDIPRKVDSVCNIEWKGVNCITCPDLKTLRQQWLLKQALCDMLRQTHPGLFNAQLSVHEPAG
ncbi:MAG: hypothetical protein KUG75_01890, partial [Pseudomonadales bacterium]|nr:hypothetical protein [Pseudomonadales bacterium]